MKLGKGFGVALFATSLVYSAVNPQMVYAEETEEITSGAVTVTATRSEKSLLNVPMSVTVISAEEIERTMPVDLVDVLKGIPGIIISQGNTSAIEIRGETPNQTLVLIDGVKVSSDYGVGEFGNQLPFIDPSFIERIEIIKGPASVLYGAEAMGGVVNIILKKDAPKAIGGNISTSYQVNRDGKTSSAGMYGKVGDLDFRISGTYQDLEDIEQYHTTEPDTGRMTSDLMAYAGYAINDNIKAGLTFDHSENQYQRYVSSGSAHTDSVSDRLVADIKFSNITSFLGNVKATASYFDSDSQAPGYASSGSLDDLDDTNINNLAFALQSDWYMGDHTAIIAGYDFLNENYDFARTRDLTSTSTTVGAGSYVENRTAKSFTNAAYVAIEHYLPLDFTLNYGARYTHHGDESDEQYRHYRNGGTRKVSGAHESTESDIVFNAGLVWAGIDNVALRATFGQGFNPASIMNKYYEFQMNTAGTLWNVGDPNMKPETSDTYEVGARYDNGTTNVDLVGFYSVTDNRFDTYRYTNAAGITYVQYMNVSESEAWGLELGLSHKFAFGLEPYFNGTIQRRRDNISAGSGGADPQTFVDDLPAYYATAGVKFYDEIMENLYLNADLSVFHQAEYEGYDRVGFVTTMVTREAYTNVNLSVGVEYGEEKDFYAQVNINNLLDTKYYYESADELEAGINGGITIGYRF